MPLLRLLLRHGTPTCDVLGERAQIGLACAAGRVNVGGLDSWLALVEQPPRTDEAPETAGHSQDVPERFARALEKTGDRAEPRTSARSNAPVVPRPICPACLVDGAFLVLPVRLRAASALSAEQAASHAHRQRHRQGGQRLVRPEGARRVHALARTGGFVSLRWAGLGGTAMGQCPTEFDVATRSRESNVPINTSIPR